MCNRSLPSWHMCQQGAHADSSPRVCAHALVWMATAKVRFPGAQAQAHAQRARREPTMMWKDSHQRARFARPWSAQPGSPARTRVQVRKVRVVQGAGSEPGSDPGLLRCTRIRRMRCSMQKQTQSLLLGPTANPGSYRAVLPHPVLKDGLVCMGQQGRCRASVARPGYAGRAWG